MSRLSQKYVKISVRQNACLLVVCAYFCSPSPVFAQSTEPTQVLDTVVVTAARRAENLKDVPMSISALKADAIDAYRSGGQDIRFLAARVPSLNVESDFGRSFPRFYIRGMGNTDFDLNASQPVGLVFDDVVQSNPLLKGFPLFDMDQVEVLRGPQGTLFGRNSPAGVIKFDSAKPGKNFEATVALSYGNDATSNLDSMINLPLNQDWSMRFASLLQSRDDRVRNPRATGTQAFEGYQDNAARLQFFYSNQNFSALLGLHTRAMHGNATLFRANIIERGTNNIVRDFDYGIYPTDGINQQYLHNDGGSLRLRWDLPGMSLHAISAYDSADYLSRADVDGGYGSKNNLPMGPGLIPSASETGSRVPQVHQRSQELRAESTTRDALQWIAGWYYFDENLTIENLSFNTFANNVQNGYAVQHQQAHSWAAFASLNYALSEQLKLRGGTRYTKDQKDFNAERLISPVGAPSVGILRTQLDTHDLSWDVAANYSVNPTTNLYTRIATAYRAPSIQGRILFGNSLSIAQPEKNLTIEAGIKQDLFDKTARISASIYHYEVKDAQLTAGSGAINQNRLINADKVSGQGLELELQTNLNAHWTSSFSFSYNDTAIHDNKLFVTPCGNKLCTILNPIDGLSGMVLIDGNPLPRAPQWSGNLTLGYRQPIAQGEFLAYTDWVYKGSYNMFLYEAREYIAKPMLEGGLRLAYRWSENKYEAAFFVRNITNRQQLISAIDFNNLAGILNEPRAFGVQLRANF